MTPLRRLARGPETLSAAVEYATGELTDDEIAVGDCMIRMADYARGGAGFYSLAEACQDRYLDIKMKEAETSGKEVRTKQQPWYLL